MSKTALYIVSTVSRSIQDEYKLGIHTGTANDLLYRYGTSYPGEVAIYFFLYTAQYRVIESKVKDLLFNHRVGHHSGNKSEWFKIDIGELIRCINGVICELTELDGSAEDVEECFLSGLNTPQPDHIKHSHEKVTCEICHRTVSKANMHRHRRTQIHNQMIPDLVQDDASIFMKIVDTATSWTRYLMRL